MRSEYNFYKNKYLKYKKKYLSLKNRIGGASNTPPPPPSAEEIGALLIERALSLKDESNKPDTYRESKAEEKEDKYDQLRAEEKEDKYNQLRAEEGEFKGEQLKDESNSKEDEIRSEIDTLIDNAEEESLVTRKSFLNILVGKMLASLPKETVRSKRMVDRSRIMGERLRKKNVDISELRH